MESPELGFGGGFYNSRDAAIDEAFLMMRRYATPFTVKPGMHPERVAARTTLLNTREPVYLERRIRDTFKARKARDRFGSVVQVVDSEPYGWEEIQSWHTLADEFYRQHA